MQCLQGRGLALRKIRLAGAECVPGEAAAVHRMPRVDGQRANHEHGRDHERRVARQEPGGLARDAVEEFFRLFADAWKTNDGAAVASFFVSDGSLINPFGQRADGRDAVAAMYSEYFEGMLRGTSTAIDVASVRGVESNHVLVDGEQTIMASSGEIILVAHLVALLGRDGDSWLFVDGRPYTFPAITA